MRRFFLTLSLLLIPILAIHAQEPDSGWEIIERCVGEPTTPPDDWTFGGTILATGWAGIHGINANFEVPVVQVFREQRWLDVLNSYSPDYEWFAIAHGELETPRCPSCSSSIYRWDNVTVYSTVNQSDQYTYTINTTFGIYPLITNNRRLIWYDNDHLFLSHSRLDFLWNPSTDEETELDAIIHPVSPINENFPSIDRTIAVYYSDGEFNVVSPETGGIIRKFPYTEPPSIVSAWSSDNQYFATQPFYDSSQLDIYFHDTGLVEPIWDTIDERRIDDFEWSSDSRYLSFRERSIYSDGDPAQTFIVDMQSREIYSLCTHFDSSAWSPNGSQLSATLPDDDAIYIFDISNWQLMNTGIYHSGSIVGWREDPKISTARFAQNSIYRMGFRQPSNLFDAANWHSCHKSALLPIDCHHY